MRTRGMAFVACLAIAATAACNGPTPSQSWTLAKAKMTEEGWQPLYHVTDDGVISYWIACSGERDIAGKGKVAMLVVRVSKDESKIDLSEFVDGARCGSKEAPKTEATPPPQ